jgi:hypothetical protein
MYNALKILRKFGGKRENAYADIFLCSSRKLSNFQPISKYTEEMEVKTLTKNLVLCTVKHLSTSKNIGVLSG